MLTSWHSEQALRARERARAALMSELVAKLADDGIDHLIIESRGERSDDLDRAVILDGSRQQFSYEWRTKSEPLLWFADALAGAAREIIADPSSPGLGSLQAGGFFTGVEWLASTRDMRKPRLPS